MSRLNTFKTRPKVSPIDLKSYLEKLEVFKELPSLNYLRKIHRQHLLKIPFENLDVHFRNPITIEIRSIYDKIIPTSRGGFCYELNYLFYHLLVHLGYECQLISARVIKGEEMGPEYDHLAILVKLRDDLYLCDVGFGSGITYPKKIEENTLQMDVNQYFQVTKDENDFYFLNKTTDTLKFESLYRFELKFREPIEFIDMCDFHQSNPDSTFVGRKIMTKLTEEGRVTLTDDLFTIQELGERSEYPVLNEDAFYSKMEEHFGISYQSLLQDRLGR